MPQEILRIALLHLAPAPAEIDRNRRLIDQAVEEAGDAGASWVLTPELVVCGYSFADRIGTEWIAPQPDPWMTGLARRTARRRLTMFLSHPERDRRSNRLHNSLFVLTPAGTVTVGHRKINTLRVGSEAWSTPGTLARPLPVPPLERVGFLICADAFSPRIASTLRAQGARLLVSSAAWAPGFHGPNGEWERCTRLTDLPLIVCNRTGPDARLDFSEAESVVCRDGRRLLSLSAPRSTIFLLDWHLPTGTLASLSYERIEL